MKKQPPLPVLSLFLLILMLPLPMTAAEPSGALSMEPMVVTATRDERKSSEVPASISTVDEERIDQSPMANITEVLRSIPGVLIDSPNQGYDARLIIRGAGLKARYGIRDIMVLLDGVPITDPDSMTRLDFIDTQLIKQIEVVRGPNATLWGANASGGVINIIPKSPLDADGSVIKLGAGDYGTRNYHLSFSDNAAETFYYTLSGSRRESDNSWRRWNRFETTQATFQGALACDNDAILESFFGYTHADLQLPGKLDADQFATYEETGKAMETEGPWQYSGRYSEIFFANARYRLKTGQWDFNPLVYYNQWRHLHPVTGRINDAQTRTFGTDLQAAGRHLLMDMPGTLTMGATGRWDDQETDYFEYADLITLPNGRIVRVVSDRKGNRMEKQDRTAGLYGCYVQESLRPSSRFIVDAGVRFDTVRMAVSGSRTGQYSYSMGQYIPAGDPAAVKKTYNSISPRLGVTFRVTDGLNVYGNISRATQAPTEGEISENPDLDAVTVRNYELGFKVRTPGWTLDTVAYDAPMTKEVVQVIGPGGESEYVNSGKTHRRGFEVSGAWHPARAGLDGIEVGASYAWTDYTFADFSEEVRMGSQVINADRSGNTLPFIPTHQYAIHGTYQAPCGLQLRLEAFTWGTYFMDNGNTETYGGYDFVFNAMMGYHGETFSAALNVDNLFDKQYAVEVRKDTQGVKRYTPAAPRTFMVRLTFRF